MRQWSKEVSLWYVITGKKSQKIDQLSKLTMQILAYLFLLENSNRVEFEIGMYNTNTVKWAETLPK